ncbi:MAG: DUF456 domain-containing protein [Anaerolineaceae bacterium]|nr:DUF456 domain-containing protein [Anaerolineaceae bacterium]
MMAAIPWLHWLMLALSGILNLVGLVGLLLVFFPGLTVTWLGQLIWFIYIGFNKSHGGWQFGLTIAIFVINTIIMLVGSVVDNILGATETQKKGVPWWEIGLVMLVMLVGGTVLTPIGGLAASLGVLYLIERVRLENDNKAAWESTKTLAFGYGKAAVLRFILCQIMIILWLVTLIFL